MARFLDDVPVAETTWSQAEPPAARLPETEVLPQAERAADLGLDLAPLLEVVADVLRLYAVTLEERGPAVEITPRG